MNKIFLISILLFSALSHAGDSITYPKRAEALRIGGEIEVVYDVTSEGRVSNVRIIKAIPEYVFENDIRKQMRLWRLPAGEPKDNVHLRIVFKPNSK